MLQKNTESESMRDQQQRDNERRNKVSGSQLPGCEAGVIGLVESVQEIAMIISALGCPALSRA